MRRAFAALLTALLLVNPCLPGVALALDEATLEHVVVTPVLTGTQAEDGTYTSPVQVDFDVTPGDPDYALGMLEVSIDGESWGEYTGEWPLRFSEGTHTVYWRITEYGPYGETLYTDSVSFTIVLQHVSVVPVVTGTQAEDGTYTSPVQVDFDVTPGDPDYALGMLEVSIDGESWGEYTGEWPLRFSEGTHTVYWRITEYGPYSETLYDGSVSFTVVLEHATVTPIILGEWISDGVYGAPVAVVLMLEQGEVGPALFDAWVDGVLQPWPIDTMYFTEGRHTVAWHLVEYSYYGPPCEHWGEITFTVMPDPVVLVPTVSGTQGDAGWYTSAVSVTLAEAPESAPAMWLEWSLDGTSWQPYSGSIGIAAEGHTTLFYRGISYRGYPGETKTLDIAIDTRSPSLDVMNPSYGKRILLNTSTGLVWNAFDEMSGLAEGYPFPALGQPLDTSEVGDHSVTIVARDVAGNQRSLTMPYRVIYGFRGFEKPLAADGSVFKAGEIIGVKFSLADAYGAPVSGAQAQLQATRADDPATVVATGTFREAKAGKYTFDLKTKGLAPGAYVITATLDDGESYSVSITLK